MKRLHLVLLFATLVITAACATAPPPPPAQPVITYGQKLAWIIRLEDHRVLRDLAPPPPAAPAPPSRGRRVVVQPPPPPTADLGRLVTDDEARVRRRAALAIGRIGLPEGVDLLVPRLHDGEPEVRQMAAFALGLLRDKRAIEPLRAALTDPSPLVQGRAAEALGLIGDQASAPAIGGLVASIVRTGAIARLQSDDAGYRLDPSVEAFRLGLFALTRLKAFDALGGAVLDPNGQPVSTWWPIAYALGRTPDARALPALKRLVTAGVLPRTFALRGLGALKDAPSVPLIVPYLKAWQSDPAGAIAAVRALAEIGDPRGADALVALLPTRELPNNLRLEIVTALGRLRAPASVTPLLDLVTDAWPPMRAAALGALREADLQQFLVILSGLEPDRHWSVRAATARLMGTLSPEVAVPWLTEMVKDQDPRVVAPVLEAMTKVGAPQTEATLLANLKADDPLVRAAAANGLGELKPAAGAAALVEAYARGRTDTLYAARAAALASLAKYGAAAALPALKEAFADKDWAVRVRAASLAGTLDPSLEVAAAIRPAPAPSIDYADADLVAPAFSPHVYIDTDKGTIQIELAVLDAPLTARNFVALARAGFFANVAIHRVVPNFVVQDGDARGDGEGGPGYTIRDELNELPYLTGAVGMALDWADTGGSQFFITLSPQPHLDARYTVFGRVISGMDVVNRLEQGDTIAHVRVWDGRTWSGK